MVQNYNQNEPARDSCSTNLDIHRNCVPMGWSAAVLQRTKTDAILLLLPSFLPSSLTQDNSRPSFCSPRGKVSCSFPPSADKTDDPQSTAESVRGLQGHCLLAVEQSIVYIRIYIYSKFEYSTVRIIEYSNFPKNSYSLGTRCVT